MIKKIEIKNRTGSGRVKTLKITARDGKSTEISGPRFREIIGPNVLKSNYYDVDMKGYYFDLYGRGWGHGVGMCQWGAYDMAQTGIKASNILKFYYNQIKIEKIAKKNYIIARK